MNNKKRIFSILLLAVCSISSFSTAMAQKTSGKTNINASIGIDIVSNYQWRGQELGGWSVQPTLNMAHKKLFFGLWASTPLDKNIPYANELDLSIGYTHKNLYIGVTDYYLNRNTSFSDGNYFNYSAHETNHAFEATLGYNLPYLTVEWNTRFAGADYYKWNSSTSTPKRAYSTYISTRAPFQVSQINFLAEMGISPWETALYGNKNFSVVNIGLKGTWNALFVQVGANPQQESPYVVAGITLKK